MLRYQRLPKKVVTGMRKHGRYYLMEKDGSLSPQNGYGTQTEAMKLAHRRGFTHIQLIDISRTIRIPAYVRDVVDQERVDARARCTARVCRSGIGD